MRTLIKRLYTLFFSTLPRKLITITLVIALPLGYCGSKLAFSWYHEHYGVLTTAPEIIKGKIITLKALKEEYFVDYHNMFSIDVRKNLEFPEFITLSYTIMFLQDELRKIRDGSMILYCIFDNADNKLIGSVALRDKNDSDPGQFSWWINEAYRGGGRAQEALQLICNVYFRLRPKEKSFIIHVRLWNKRSYHALKKCGATDVGFFYEDGKPTRYILEIKRK